ncbi:MAG: hypothetical protein ACRCX2_10325 [Paraclostridium sp.]
MANIRYGTNMPFCKNTRLMVKPRCKGLRFKVKLPTKDELVFPNNTSNHTIYIGYCGKQTGDDLEIGISHSPYLDGDKGYTYMHNYTSSSDTVGDHSRGTIYYPFGSEIEIVLYLDASQKLMLIINGVNVWTSARTHTWSEMLSPTGQIGTRIINSIEQSGWSSTVPHFKCSHGNIEFTDIKYFSATGWVSPTVDEVKWGYDSIYHGIEMTVDSKYSDKSQSAIGSYPTVSPGYGYVSNSFTVASPL